MFPRGGMWSFSAPDGADRLTVLCGGALKKANVKDGFATFDGDTTRTVPAGDAVGEWHFTNGSIEPGPRFAVVQSLEVDKQTADLRTYAEKMVANLQKAYEASSTSGESSIVVGDTNMTFETRDELRTELLKWELTLKQERDGSNIITQLVP